MSTRLLRVVLALVLLAALAIGVGMTGSALGWLPKLTNPFGTETKDRSGPAVLKSVRDLSRYQAAEGDYQVVVDLDKDAKMLPDSLRGRRTLYVGAGSVSSYVDLGDVAENGVTVNKDRTAAKLTLPRAELDKTAKLSPDRSYVFAQQRGLLDRLGDFFTSNPGDHREVQKLAAEKIHKAAEKSGLTKRAETNTRQMLTGLLTSLGFKQVTVEFEKA